MSKSQETQFWSPQLTLERLGGDQELFVDMIQIFLDEAPKQVQTLRKSIDTKNARTLEYTAHRLKGDLDHLSAQKAVEYARTLENAAHRADLTHASAILATLEDELKVIYAAMRTVCAHRCSTERT